MPTRFGVVDLFAGPGGLGEGFASLEVAGQSPFRLNVSIEKETSAHRTLSLRAFVRQYRKRHAKLPDAYIDFQSGLEVEPDWQVVDPWAWKQSQHEALCLELGTPDATEAIRKTTRKMSSDSDETVLIGGPPCQAYSLVGRVRSRANPGYVPEEDGRHYLFREYIGVLDHLRPAAFLMENVKGILSSRVENRQVFEMLLEDLTSLGGRRGDLYQVQAVQVQNGQAYLRPPERPSDFIVRAEEFGIPQSRHRVILVGIRSDLAKRNRNASISLPATHATVGESIGMLPALRSGLSRGRDEGGEWQRVVAAAAVQLERLHRRKKDEDLRAVFADLPRFLSGAPQLPRSSGALPQNYGRKKGGLMGWLERPELRALGQHETRSHMASDLGRYLFAAVHGAVRGSSPRAMDFPSAISPAHQNWLSGNFNDRFRVQLEGEPSSTITSHIAKDGHYFIHPEPRQCRSLTVREAARLQTFPDDYLFLGNRTQQYVQVGNAVPPYLARQIAALVYERLTGDKPTSTDDHLVNKSRSRQYA